MACAFSHSFPHGCAYLRIFSCAISGHSFRTTVDVPLLSVVGDEAQARDSVACERGTRRGAIVSSFPFDRSSRIGLALSGTPGAPFLLRVLARVRSHISTQVAIAL